MTADKRGLALERAITTTPEDPTLHAIYADWLEERDQGAAARRQRHLARLLQDIRGKVTLFVRPGRLAAPGPEWARVDVQERHRLRERIRDLFAEAPHLTFVLLSDLPFEACGFRASPRSPVLHWDRRGGHVRDVVPAWMRMEEELEFAHREEGQSPATAIGDTSTGERWAFGQHSRPGWG